MQETTIGIDVGGTKVHAVLLNSADNQILERHTTPSIDDGPSLIQLLSSLIKKITENAIKKPHAVGVGIAGLAHRSGILRYSPNLSGLIEFPIKEELENSVGYPVFIGNDATVGAVAEWKLGAGKGSNNFAFVTLGTGIGTGLVVDGRLLLGQNGFAGEAGHMTIDMNGPTYLTGHKGPWEYFASGVALNRLVQTEALKGDFPWASSKVENTQAVIGRHLHLGVNEGEVDSLRILDKFCKELSIGLTNLVLLLDLELIVIGGGLCEIGEPLRKNVENWIEKLLPGENHRPTIKVKLAETGVDAGAVGAALSAYNYFNL